MIYSSLIIIGWKGNKKAVSEFTETAVRIVNFKKKETTEILLNPEGSHHLMLGLGMAHNVHI
jgi:hypothetical protein